MNGMNAPATLNEALQSRGHRLTKPRQVVWAVLNDAGGHLTAEQVTTRAQDYDRGINRASVYRSLTLFVELGLARESNLGTDEAARWELAHPDDHFHLICESCGDVQHHVGDLVEQVRSHLSGGHGFTSRRIELSVVGLCQNCS